MASLTYTSAYNLDTLPLELVLFPLARSATTTNLTYTLTTGFTLTLGGSFVNDASGNPLSGTVQSLTYKQGTSTLVSIAALDLSFEQFLSKAASGDVTTLLDGFGGSSLGGIDSITGSSSNDLIHGLGGSDVINGNGGADRIYGDAGNDQLLGGIGADTLIGGNGNDTLDSGSDTDIDYLLGGSGDDWYLVRGANDRVAEGLAAGIDTVQTTLANYTLTDNVEHLRYSGNAAFTGTGNTLDNQIRGGIGADSLSGANGNDSLYGGVGNDTLNGGNGDDLLAGDSGSALVNAQASLTAANGNAYTLNLLLPEVSASTTVTATGYIGRGTGSGERINLAFVMDVSSSMRDASLVGTTTIGDRNGDGYSNTRLDAVVTSFESLIASIQAAGLADRVNIAVIPYADGASTNFSGSATLDVDANGVADVIEIVRSLRIGSDYNTNYALALTHANAFFNSATDSSSNHVFFLSDGQPNNQNYAGQLAVLRDAAGIDATIRAISVGETAQYDVLDLLDDNLANHSAIQVSDPDQLQASLIGSQVALSDIARVELLRDGTLVSTLLPAQLTETPFGLRYSTSITGLTTASAHQIKARLVLTDGSRVLVGSPVAVGSYGSADSLVGGAGNDTLDGGLGNDTMVGGTGDDTYRVNASGDVVTESASQGTDTIETSLTYTLTQTQVENLTLLGSTAVNATGNALANVITGNIANNVLIGGAGSDTLDGNWGVDTVDYRATSVAVRVDLGAGTVSGGDSDTLVSIENVVGTFGNDTLIGSDGNNLLDGSKGNDELNGEYGSDTLIGGEGNDTIDGGGYDYYSGLADTASYAGASGAVSITLNGSYGSATGADGTDTLESIENITGSNFNDIITDTYINYDYANRFDGGAGNDSINGGGGNDTLIGGTGNDTLIGGIGNDVYDVDSTGDVVTENSTVATEIDTVQSSISFSLNVSNRQQIENLTLSGNANLTGAGNAKANLIIGNAGNNALTGVDGNDTLIGGTGNDSLDGGNGNDILDGGTGSDSMTGGAGNDYYLVDASTDVVVETSTGGTDTIDSQISLTLGTYVENLVLNGTGNINGTGNAASNNLTGNSGNNLLSGLAGDDTLFGASGNDTLKGGAGDDALRGGDGIDTVDYSAATAAITVDLAGSPTQVYENDDWHYYVTANGEGNDRLESIENVIGSNFADTLSGTIEYNQTLTLRGGGGNDSITGNDGSDMLYGDAGNDSITGNDGSDMLYGDAGNDSITGNDGSDMLYGDAGNDSISGEGGNDTLAGGTGNDTLDGGYGFDSIDYSGITGSALTVDLGIGLAQFGSETDTLISIEGIIGTALNDRIGYDGGGTNYSDLYLAGGAGNDTLTGSSGNDTIDGGLGTDMMNGGDGDDTYYVNTTADIVSDSNGYDDTVISTVSLTLGGGIENLQLNGTAALNGAGSFYDNQLTGNAAANTLDGSAGNDTLTGELGADRLIGGLGADRFRFASASDSTASALDVITDFNRAQGDRIDLSDINADISSYYDRDFAFRGTAAFTGAAGDLRYQISGGNTLLMGDTDGDGKADFQVQITGIVALTSNDLIL